MSVTAIKAGKAFYEILAEDKTDAGIGSAERKLRKIGLSVGAMGLAMSGFADAALASLGAMVKAFAGAGDEISDAMNVTGLSSDFLQTLRFNAADAGVEFNALIGSLTKFNSTLAKAAAKGGKVVGLDAKDLMAMAPDERIKAVVDAIEQIPDPALRAKAAMEAFGKSGAKLLPAFEGGAAALNEAMADLKGRGLIMSDEDRQLAVQAEGAFLSMGLAIERVTQVIAAAATPAFLQAFEVIQTVIEATVQFLDANRALVAGLTVGLGVLSVVGTALFAVGVAATLASYATAGLALVTGGLAAAFAVLASPAFLITAAIVACGAAALLAAYHLDQLFNAGQGLQFLKDMAAGAQLAMAALWTAISNGRWDLAGKLITDGLNVAFTSGILALKQAWIGFANWLTDLFVQVMTEVSRVVIEGLRNQIAAIGSMTGQTGLTAGLSAILQNVGIGANQVAGQTKAATLAANKFILGDSEAEAIKATADLARTMEEIAQLDAKKQDELGAKAAGMADFGNVSDQMRQSSRIAQGVGFASSIGAGRIGFAAPPNQADEKQVELLGNIDKGIGEVADKLDDLEGLAFE